MSLAADIDSVASVQPRIVILDDEFAQRAGLCLQLGVIGYFDFIEFDDPRPALEYLRQHPVDLIIVDIRMPHLPVDGLWFMEQFRAFDSVTSIVIRTAHDDLAIADAALEARAIRRVLKSHPQANDLLRRSVSLGIVETRERRRTQHDAATSVSARETLVDVLARTDDRITVAEMCHGFAAGLVGQVETIAAHAAALDQAALPPDALRALAVANRAAVDRLRDQLNTFLNNSYVSTEAHAPGVGQVHDCLDALATALAHNRVLAHHALSFTVQRPESRHAFYANPHRILTALRHLAEFCALHARRGTTLALAARLEPNLPAALGAVPTGQLVLNARAASPRPCLAFTLGADLVDFPLDRLHTALRTCSVDPRVANLLLLSAAVIDDHLVFVASLSPTGPATFTLYLPAAEPR